MADTLFPTDEKDTTGIISYTSFITVEKVLQDIVDKLAFHKPLQKLLYYSEKHCLSMKDLTQDQIFSLLGNQIKIVPKLQVDENVMAYIIISFERFIPTLSTTSFREITLSFDILCHYDYWSLDDFKLRPYSIAGAIDGTINKSSFAGVGGVANFVQAKQLVLNEYLGGVTLDYTISTLGEDYDRATTLQGTLA